MAPQRRGRYGRYRYGPWQGGPDPLAPPYDVRRALDALGAEAMPGSAEEFGRFIAAETSRYADIIRRAGIRPR